LESIPFLEGLFKFEMCEKTICRNCAKVINHKDEPRLLHHLHPLEKFSSAWAAASESPHEGVKCTDDDCRKSGKADAAYHKMGFVSDPLALAVLLTRFQYSRFLQNVLKDSTSLSWPMKFQMRHEERLTTYKLKSFLSHCGRDSASGHYVAFICKSLPEREHDLWIRCNDRHLDVCKNPQEALADSVYTPYMLFYESI